MLVHARTLDLWLHTWWRAIRRLSLIRCTNADPRSQQYFEIRSRNILKLKETQSPNPYPHKFHVTTSITNYIEKYGAEGKIAAGQKLEGTTEALAGRIHNVRASGQNLRFYDLHGEGVKVQIMANKQ